LGRDFVLHHGFDPSTAREVLIQDALGIVSQIGESESIVGQGHHRECIFDRLRLGVLPNNGLGPIGRSKERSAAQVVARDMDVTGSHLVDQPR
jgi:hypothetical protein